MIYRCFLNDILVNEPIGLDAITDTLSRNQQEKGITYTIDVELQFTGSGYDYLLNRRDTIGFTDTIELRIEQSEQSGSSWFYFFEGLVFLTHVKFSEKIGVATSKVVDTSYFAKIENNKDTPFFLYGSKSKNNVSITPCTKYLIQYFDVTAGTYIALPSSPGGYEGAAYKAFEVLRFAIEWMTDNEITLVSNALDTGGEFENYFITHGRSVELVDDSAPGWSACTLAIFNSFWDRISYKTILKELGNLFNLKFAIETVNGKKSIRIEPDGYWTDENVILDDLINLEEIVTGVNTSLLYSSIKIGTSNLYQDNTMLFPEYIDFLGYKNEDLPVIGSSNIGNNALDIQTDWFKSSNVFQYLLYNGTASDSEWDRKVGIIHAELDSGIIYKTVNTDFLSTGFLYFNETLTNKAISERFLGGIPNALASYLGAGDDEFMASNTVSLPLLAPLEPIPFDNDTSPPNFDTNNNYDAGLTYQYTIPQSGVFTFAFDWNIHFVPISGTSIQLAIYFVRYDSSGFGVNPQLSEYIAFFDYTLVGPSRHIIGSSAFIGNAGEKIVMKVTWINALNFTILPNSLFKCINTTTGGGVYQTYDPDDINIYTHEFESPFSPSQMKNIIDNPKGMIRFAIAGQQSRRGRIESAKERYKDGKANFILSSTKKLNS